MTDVRPAVGRARAHGVPDRSDVVIVRVADGAETIVTIGRAGRNGVIRFPIGTDVREGDQVRVRDWTRSVRPQERRPEVSVRLHGGPVLDGGAAVGRRLLRRGRRPERRLVRCRPPASYASSARGTPRGRSRRPSRASRRPVRISQRCMDPERRDRAGSGFGAMIVVPVAPMPTSGRRRSPTARPVLATHRRRRRSAHPGWMPPPKCAFPCVRRTSAGERRAGGPTRRRRG